MNCPMCKSNDLRIAKRITSVGKVSFPDIDSRMVIVPKGTTSEEVLDHREWEWGDITAK